MNFTITVNPKGSPNEVGELLRREFFKEEYETFGGEKYRKLGCYSTFELAEGVVDLGTAPLDNDWGANIKVHSAKKIIDGQEIRMEYWWDGDGDLSFYFPDGSMLSNTDCKKTNNWEYV